MGPSTCTPLLWVLRGQKGLKLGPAANNGENIASGRQSLAASPLLLHHNQVL